MRRAVFLLALLVLFSTACARGPAPPAQPDTRNDACAWCRMTVSDLRFAAQLVGPSEEPRFFDDIGCLASFLKGDRAPAKGQIAYVADHRTKQWVRAASALYTKNAAVQTPMNSFLIAHADAVSRDADPDAKGRMPMTVAEVYGPGGPPDGR